jgi:pimeloyl-ACP methyl ester carboxylesterase
VVRVLLVFLAVLVAIPTAGALDEHVSAWRDARRFPAPGRLVDVGGRKIHIQCMGTGSPAVIFEAGGTHDSMQYSSIQTEVAKRTRACAYDRAGMGWSDPSPDALDARSLERDLDRVLDGAGVAPPYVFVVGSAGGLTVELFARDHSEHVAGIVWLDALSGEMVDTLDGATAPLERRAEMARLLAHVGLLGFFDPHGFADLPEAERERAIARSYHRAPWDALCSLIASRHASAAAIRQAPPLRDDLPLLVVVRDHPDGFDPALEPRWRRAQERFAERSRNGRLVVATGSGHHPESDRPDLVLQAVADLLDRTHASPP